MALTPDIRGASLPCLLALTLFLSSTWCEDAQTQPVIAEPETLALLGRHDGTPYDQTFRAMALRYREREQRIIASRLRADPAHALKTNPRFCASGPALITWCREHPEEAQVLLREAWDRPGNQGTAREHVWRITYALAFPDSPEASYIQRLDLNADPDLVRCQLQALVHVAGIHENIDHPVTAFLIEACRRWDAPWHERALVAAKYLPLPYRREIMEGCLKDLRAHPFPYWVEDDDFDQPVQVMESLVAQEACGQHAWLFRNMAQRALSDPATKDRAQDLMDQVLAREPTDARLSAVDLPAQRLPASAAEILLERIRSAPEHMAAGSDEWPYRRATTWLARINDYDPRSELISLLGHPWLWREALDGMLTLAVGTDDDDLVKTMLESLGKRNDRSTYEQIHLAATLLAIGGPTAQRYALDVYRANPDAASLGMALLGITPQAIIARFQEAGVVPADYDPNQFTDFDEHPRLDPIAATIALLKDAEVALYFDTECVNYPDDYAHIMRKIDRFCPEWDADETLQWPSGWAQADLSQHQQSFGVVVAGKYYAEVAQDLGDWMDVDAVIRLTNRILAHAGSPRRLLAINGYDQAAFLLLAEPHKAAPALSWLGWTTRPHDPTTQPSTPFKRHVFEQVQRLLKTDDQTP